ncbi:hypothetical protein Hanom_Chr03g00183031 [Helianthus anomalus]
MKLMSRMKMTIFETFWIQMRINKPLDESRKSGQTSGTKMAFYSFINDFFFCFILIISVFVLADRLFER